MLRLADDISVLGSSYTYFVRPGTGKELFGRREDERVQGARA